MKEEFGRNFSDSNNQPFFIKNNLEVHIGFALNLDWFNPCKHIQYSVGVIYLTLLNLPRHIRFHEDNTFVVGIIPDLMSQMWMKYTNILNH